MCIHYVYTICAALKAQLRSKEGNDKMAGTWDLTDEIKRLEEEIKRSFRSFISRSQSLPKTPLLTHPRQRSQSITSVRHQGQDIDIQETDKEIVAKIEMPGIAKEDIFLAATEDGIEVKAQRRSEIRQEDKKKGFYKLERSQSGFYRYFSLPKDADTTCIESTFKNGVLELRIPKKMKKKEEIKERIVKQIQVK